MRRLTIILNIVSLFLISANAQEIKFQEISGKVTYVSSQNVYVQFENTEGISVGDSLFVKNKKLMKPVLKVNFISSRSVAGELLNEKSELKVGDEILAHVKLTAIENQLAEVDSSIDSTAQILFVEDSLSTVKSSYVKVIEPKISGKISVQSYSNFSNLIFDDDYQRWRYSFRFNAENIGGGKFSFSNYTIFTYRADEWNQLSSNFGRSLRMYDFALNYKVENNWDIWIGRHLNRKVTNISTVDGLHLEKYFGKFSLGAIVGSRPNYYDMGYNVKLFEYGVFVSRSDSLGKKRMDNTLSIFQQTNDFKTDRRFIYFQHTNNAIDKTNIFISSEIDLFKRELGQDKSDFSLTSIYISGRYNPSNVLSFSASYDARKNVIYYETFMSYLDSIIERETRQGFRLGVNIKPINGLFFGFNFGYRSQESDIKPSRNFSGFVTYSSLPLIETSTTVSYTRIMSSFIDGSLYGFRLSKDIFNGNIYTSFSYRITDYKYLNNPAALKQSSIGLDLSSRIIDNIFLSLGYEGTFEAERTYGRVLLDLSTRF